MSGPSVFPMGLFNELGRRVEKFKRNASNAAETTEYGCRACGASFVADYDACPECDGTDIVRLHDE